MKTRVRFVLLTMTVAAAAVVFSIPSPAMTCQGGHCLFTDGDPCTINPSDCAEGWLPNCQNGTCILGFGTDARCWCWQVPLPVHK